MQPEARESREDPKASSAAAREAERPRTKFASGSSQLSRLRRRVARSPRQPKGGELYSTPGMLRRGERVVPYILILPALAIVFFLLVYPIFYGAYLSLYGQVPGDLSLTGEFVGFQQYFDLWETEQFRWAVVRSLIYVIGIWGLGIGVGLLGALTLSQIHKGKRLWRALALMPYLFSTVAVGVSWRFFLNRDAGLVNQVLSLFGIDGPAYLASSLLALPSVIIAMVWAFSPLPTLVLLAGFENLNPEIEESCKVDGAKPRQRFRHITLPLIAPQVGIASFWLLFIAFNTFAVVLPMTGGGPGRSSEPLALYLYRVGFQQMDVNAASAVMVVLLVLNITLGALAVVLSRRRD